MNDFFTWTTLATFGGASLGTTVVTQYIKELPGIRDLATQVTSYFVALVILALANVAIGDATNISDWLIIPFNAVLVSYAANGSFDFLKRFNQQEE